MIRENYRLLWAEHTTPKPSLVSKSIGSRSRKPIGRVVVYPSVEPMLGAIACAGNRWWVSAKRQGSVPHTNGAGAKQSPDRHKTPNPTKKLTNHDTPHLQHNPHNTKQTSPTPPKPHQPPPPPTNHPNPTTHLHPPHPKKNKTRDPE